MDKTEIFIEMCEKAEELQKIGRVKATELDDWYYEKATQLFSIGTFADENDIWLPRQDQLQEMAFEHIKKEYPSHIEREYNYNTSDLETDFHHYLADYYNIAVLNENYKLFKTTTFEQLWLMFVMKKCYNKIWNGGDGEWEE